MKSNLISWLSIAFVLAVAGILAAQTPAPKAIYSSPPTYVPNMSHESDHLTEATLKWDAMMKSTNVPADSTAAHFVFNFKNVAVQMDRTLVTNITTQPAGVAARHPASAKGQMVPVIASGMLVTNVAWVTNSVTPVPVVITDVHPSCGCTTAELPPRPWTVMPGASEHIGVTVNLAGKFGMIVKTVHITTDWGSCDLIMQINIRAREVPKLDGAEMARQMSIAKVDRQAVFKNDCAGCHATPAQGKYGKDLYDAVCGICHESEHRASMVPDLHTLKVPTNQDFWRTWIAHGKPGTFMPAFSTVDGGPLNDMQIASLAAFLNATIPSAVPSPQ